MPKRYIYKADHKNPVLPLLKWLRKYGTKDVTYRLGICNYSKVEIEFFDDKLELMYTMEYDWKQR